MSCPVGSMIARGLTGFGDGDAGPWCISYPKVTKAAMVRRANTRLKLIVLEVV